MADGGLEIDDDIAFQRRMWIWQRRAWGGIAAVLAFAAVGGFGFGPLSWAEAHDEAERLHVVYERFGRQGAPSEVEVVGEAAPDGRLKLRLGAAFLEDFDVGGLEPYHAETLADDDGATLVVPATPGAKRVAVGLEIRPRSPGRGRIVLGLDGGRPLTLTQFVYP